MLLKTEKLLKVFLKRVTPFQFAFCSAKNSLTPSLKVPREKAILAFELINLISLDSVNQISIKKSLKESILEVIKTKPDLQPESRKYFEQFFIDGIQINDRIFSQDRTKKAKNPQSQRLVFYPTFMVTGQVFRLLRNISQGTSMLAGHPGISKTTSVCLFYYLTKIIDEYRFIEGVEMNKQMKKIPKIVYWSIIITQYKLETIKELILLQCPEINNLKNIKDVNSFNDSNILFELYQKAFPGTQLILIVDQINNLKSQQRNVVEESKKPPSQLSSHQKNQLQQRSHQVISIFKSIQNLLLHFKTVLYMSSMNPENKKPKKVQLTTSKNQLLPQILRIQYPSILYRPVSLMQLVNYFLFEVEQRIISQIQHKEIYENIKQKLRQQCFSYLKNKQPEFFIAPLDFRVFINNLQKNWFKQTHIVQEDWLKKQLLEEFIQQIDKTKERYINLLKNHFQKTEDKDKRRKIMFQLYQECYLSKFQQKKSSSLSKNKEKNYNRYKDKININNLSWSKQQVFQLVDRRLFDMKTIQSNQIDLLLPIEFLQKFLEQYVSQHIGEYLNGISYFLQGSYTPQQLGNLVQNLLILIIKCGQTHAVLKLGNIYNETNLINVNFNFQNQTIFGFEALPTVQGKQYSLISRLKEKIDQMIKLCKPSAAFFPLKKEFLKKQQQIELQKINGISKMIDFIWIKSNILQYNQKGGSIEVWVIDVTVSATEVQKKILDFLNEFPKFSDCHQTSFRYGEIDYKITVNYIIFGPQVVKFQKTAFIKKFNSKKNKQALKLEQKEPLSQKMLKVKSPKNKKYLLDYVGYINMSKDLTFEKKSNNTVLNFKAALESMEQLIKKRQTQRAQLKK